DADKRLINILLTEIQQFPLALKKHHSFNKKILLSDLLNDYENKLIAQGERAKDFSEPGSKEETPLFAWGKFLKEIGDLSEYQTLGFLKGFASIMDLQICAEI